MARLPSFLEASGKNWLPSSSKLLTEFNFSKTEASVHRRTFAWEMLSASRPPSTSATVFLRVAPSRYSHALNLFPPLPLTLRPRFKDLMWLVRPTQIMYLPPLFLWPHHVACRIFHWPGIKSGPPAVEAGSPFYPLGHQGSPSLPFLKSIVTHNIT